METGGGNEKDGEQKKERNEGKSYRREMMEERKIEVRMCRDDCARKG